MAVESIARPGLELEGVRDRRRLVGPVLPAVFRIPMPDDSLLSTPKGTVLIFDCNAEPRVGHGVLVEDPTGRWHVRRYVVVRDHHFRAEATAPGYSSFDSITHKVRVVAVLIGRLEDGSVG